jgi:hypothetical protein
MNMQGRTDLLWDFEFWQARQDVSLAYANAAIALEERAKGNPKYDVVCRFWLDGMCSAGERCFYKHVYIEDKMPLCVYIGMPRCSEGVFCKFRHYYLPGEEKSTNGRQDPVRHGVITAETTKPPE